MVISPLCPTLPNGLGTVVLSSPYRLSINLGLWSYGIYELVWTVKRDNCPPLPTSATCLQLIVIDDEDPVITP
ncbi:MAG: hypothetical protein IPO48_07310 [Saprospiraceae bacterium]|nr:hypothetical protein [Saprospiraceae bacterium]